MKKSKTVNLNQAILIGRIASEPKEYTTQNNKQYNKGGKNV